MQEVMVGRHGGNHIRIRVLRRMYAEETDYWDGNWLEAEIRIRIRPWDAEYRAQLRAEEFATFRQQTEALYEGASDQASFEPMEPWLTFTLQREDALGHILLRGEAGPEGHGRVFGQTRLVIEVPDFIDLTFLPPIIGQLKVIEKEFPVIGRPND